MIIRKKKPVTLLDVCVTETQILSRLNAEPSNDFCRRVEFILESLLSIREHLGTYAAIQKLGALRPALSRYQWQYSLAMTAADLRTGQRAIAEGLTEDDYWEHGAVRTLLSLAESEDGMTRVKRCATCRRWFYAFRADKKFCGAACRQKRYDTDPERRLAKLEHMRSEYAAAKKREKNPKNGVGLRSVSKRAGNASQNPRSSLTVT